MALVADYFEVSVESLCSARRYRELVRQRSVAMWLCRKHTSASYPSLARAFGKRCHTTVMAACERVESRRQVEVELGAQVDDLDRLVQQRLLQREVRVDAR